MENYNKKNRENNLEELHIEPLLKKQYENMDKKFGWILLIIWQSASVLHNNLFFLKYIYLINKKNFTMKTFLIMALALAVAGMLFRLVICVRSTTPQITYKEDKILKTSRVLSWGLAIGLAITAPICLIPWMWLKVALLVILWTITVFFISIDLSLVWAKPISGGGNGNSSYYSFLDSVSPYTWDRTSSAEWGGGDC